jgi:acyl carrier protein
MNNRPNREALVAELISLILSAVNLQHIDPSTLSAHTPLMGTTDGGLGLDSVDILEVVVVVEHRYEIKIDNADTGKQIFQTFGTIADFLLSR